MNPADAARPVVSATKLRTQIMLAPTQIMAKRVGIMSWSTATTEPRYEECGGGHGPWSGPKQGGHGGRLAGSAGYAGDLYGVPANPANLAYPLPWTKKGAKT